MTQPVELLPNIFAVKLPQNDRIYKCEITSVPSTGLSMLNFLDSDENDMATLLELNGNNWSLIGVGISEEVAGKIVDRLPRNKGYRNYSDDKWILITATESLISLLKSKGLNPEDNHVFLTLNK